MNYLISIILIWLLYAAWIACIKKPVCLHDFGVKEVLPFKGVLAFLIIAHHLGQRIPSPVLDFNFLYWGLYVVAMFFFMTGYGLTISYMKKGSSYLQHFIKYRIWKVLSPYLVAILIYALYRYVYYPDFNLYKALISKLDFSEVLLPTSWFIVAIILFYIAFYIVMSVCKKMSISIIFLFGYTIAYYFVFNKLLSFGPWWTKTIFAVIIGMIYAYNEKKVQFLIKNNGILTVAFMGGGFLLLYVVLPIVCGKYSFQLPNSYYLFTTAVIPLFVVLAMSYTGFFSNKLLSYIGQYSYEIYLVQGALCNELMRYNSNALLYTCLVYLLSVAFAWIIHKTCSFMYSR